jgi:CHRD domain
MKQIGIVILGILAGLFVACAPAAGSNSKTVAISPIGSLSSGATSQVAGTATISADSPKSKVTVSLRGLEPNSKHAGHLHVGTCSAVGPVAVGLSVITADASGNGSSTTEVDTAKLAGAYVAFHQRGPDDANGIGSFITCGEIK